MSHTHAIPTELPVIGRLPGEPDGGTLMIAQYAGVCLPERNLESEG